MQGFVWVVAKILIPENKMLKINYNTLGVNIPSAHMFPGKYQSLCTCQQVWIQAYQSVSGPEGYLHMENVVLQGVSSLLSESFKSHGYYFYSKLFINSF